MSNVMMLENVLACLALMETSVTHVPRDFLDFQIVEVSFSSNFQKIHYLFFFTFYLMSFIECNCHQDGSLDGNCNDTGKCSCKHGFDGDKCNTCAKGLFGFPRCQGIDFFSIFLKNNNIFSLLSILLWSLSVRFKSISRVISHVTCYKFNPLIQHLHLRANLVKDFFFAVLNRRRNFHLRP